MNTARFALLPTFAGLLLLAALPPTAPSAFATPIEPVAEQVQVIPAVVVAAQPSKPVEAPAPDQAALEEAELSPGEFVWKPELAQSGAVEVVVSIPLQRAYVYRGTTLIGVSTVSTGKKGHSTPTGRFPILEKRPKHFSNRYNNAPMPFMQRLTWDGIALHAGQIPGHPASHGCVRLPLAFAKLLFGATKVGAAVHILPQAPAAAEALAMARAGTGVYAGMGGPLEEVAEGSDK